MKVFLAACSGVFVAILNASDITQGLGVLTCQTMAFWVPLYYIAFMKGEK